METWREGARAGHTHEPNEVTIQLDGLGRQLSELLPEPGAPEGSEGPVFVDESGRRSKTFRRFGWVIAAVCVCFAATLVGTVLGGNSSAPFLPLSGQEEHRNADEVQVPPSAPVGSADASASPGATAGTSPSAPMAGNSAPVPPGSSAAAGSPAAGTGPSAPPAVVPVGDRSAATTGGGGTASSAGTPASTPPAADTGAPPAEPETEPSDTTTTPPPAESADPPVEEQEGAN
ncbi:hypothetical protein ACFVQ0_33360 [Streptomyces sp. NPDC057900]|uniref:hypothetical protein n=1 Tax=Streptomyces sp. NPDC057900 TaxID=3346274 RepID=UPI0036E99C07